MQKNLITAELTAEARDNINTAITTLEQNLAFLIDLNTDERRALSALGDRTQSFTIKALDVATNHEDILPRSFEVAEFQRDLALFNDLKQLLRRLSPLLDKLDDTALAAGNDAYNHALAVYGYAKAAGKGLGLDELVADMKSQFSRRRRSADPAPAEA